MIELKDRYNASNVLYKSETAETVKDALVEAVTNKTHLRGADLSGADLSGADLRGADLSGAYLSGAYLSGAYLRGAYLSGAYLIDAGQDIRGYRFIGYWREGLRIIAGCRDFTITEAEEYWEEAHCDEPELQAECLARVALIKKLAQVYKWEKKFAQKKVVAA